MDPTNTNPALGVHSSYLSTWYDAGLEIPEGISKEAIITEERERIGGALAVVLYAVTLPRRLGGDAADEELALDKRRCRRLAWALKQSYNGWHKKLVLPDNENIRIAGAQLDWSRFPTAHLTRLDERTRFVITWAIRSGDAKIARWGRSALTNFSNERNWVTYAMRD